MNERMTIDEGLRLVAGAFVLASGEVAWRPEPRTLSEQIQARG